MMEPELLKRVKQVGSTFEPCWHTLHLTKVGVHAVDMFAAGMSCLSCQACQQASKESAPGAVFGQRSCAA